MQELMPNIFAINAIAALLVGAYTYFADKKKAQNSIWLVYNILFCIWNFSIYKALDTQDATMSLYWLRTSLAALIFLVPVFLHFLSIYSDKEIFKKQILGKIYILFFLFFAASFLLPNEFIKGISSTSHFANILVPGLAFNIFTFVFAGFVFCGFYYLLHSSKLYLAFKRNQRLFLFLGMFFGIFAPVSFLLAVYQINVFPIGIFGIIPYLGFASYAILRYHVFEMDIVLNKTVVLSYFTLFVLLAHMFIVHVLHKMAGIEYLVASTISGGIVLLNILFIAHYAGLLKIDKAANYVVYEKKLAYYKFLDKFNAVSNTITDLSDLSNYIIDALIDTVGIKSATFYLYNEENAHFKLIAHRGVKESELRDISQISGDNAFIKFLGEGNIYVSSESKDFADDYDLDKIKKAFERINTSLSVPLYYSLPLYHKKSMAGFLNLGNKKDDSPYSREDIDILNAFGRQLSASIDNAKLYSRAIEDDLTKLYRVSYFNKRIQEEVARAKRYHRPFSLLFLDIDDFKKINDTYGHQAGDKVLKKVATIIKTNIRKSDIAARYGGEEFSIVMPETNKENAIIGAERIRKAVEKESGNEDKRFSVTVSIGVVDYRAGIERYQLLKEADEALYKAKDSGKNKVC